MDRISDPLIHLVRNAIDHGLESDPEARVRLGKPPVGSVALSAFHKGGNIHIEIRDDGRGMDRERILGEAIKRGLLASGEGLEDSDVFRLICEAGFSTKKVVTSLSGRGVGMDVVKRQIERMGGTLQIQSELGKGSCFTMHVPLTLAVIDGLVIRLGGGRYVIPTLNVVRLVETGDEEPVTVFGTGEMLVLSGETLPVLRLERTFGFAASAGKQKLVVVAEAEGQRVAILIDELLGQQQAVIKSLGSGLGELPGVSGCTIMSDGRVGLVLDVAGLVALTRRSPSVFRKAAGPSGALAEQGTRAE